MNDDLKMINAIDCAFVVEYVSSLPGVQHVGPTFNIFLTIINGPGGTHSLHPWSV